MRRIVTDILILGSGGAGLLGALHAHKVDPTLDITIAVKGLLGKSGCTRMVQGGYNVALAAADSAERHFGGGADSGIEGAKFKRERHACMLAQAPAMPSGFFITA